MESIWFIFIICHAMFDFKLIGKERPNYLLSGTIRGMAAIFYGIGLNVTPDLFFHWLIVTMFPFPFVFNGVLNYLRGKRWNYYGADSGWIEKFVVKYNLQTPYFITTTAMFVFALYVLIKFF